MFFRLIKYSLVNKVGGGDGPFAFRPYLKEKLLDRLPLLFNSKTSSIVKEEPASDDNGVGWKEAKRRSDKKAMPLPGASNHGGGRGVVGGRDPLITP